MSTPTLCLEITQSTSNLKPKSKVNLRYALCQSVILFYGAVKTTKSKAKDNSSQKQQAQSKTTGTRQMDSEVHLKDTVRTKVSLPHKEVMCELL